MLAYHYANSIFVVKRTEQKKTQFIVSKGGFFILKQQKKNS